MSWTIYKDQTVYIRSVVITDVSHYVLCRTLVGREFFNFTKCTWEDELTVSCLWSHFDSLRKKAFQVGFKQVIEIEPNFTTPHSIQYVVTKYTAQTGSIPMYLNMCVKSKVYSWQATRFFYRNEHEARVAVNNLLLSTEVKTMEKPFEVKVSPTKTKKAKKKRPPSVMRAFKKEVIQTIKQRRLTCISLAEETSIHECIRNDHVRDAKKYEAQLRKLGAKNMTTEILNAIKAYATECAVSFVAEFPGEQLTDSDDWDSAAFEMRHDWDDVDDAFSIFRKHLVAEIARLNAPAQTTVTTIANAAYAETLTQISPADLRSIDLRTEASKGECDCLRSSETVGVDLIEIVFFPETNRAGVAAGSDAEWTDASSAADALRRFLNDDMSP